MDSWTIFSQLTPVECKVLMYLALASRAESTRNAIAAACGISQPVAGRVLKSLLARGLVARPHYRRWTLGDGIRQLNLLSGMPSMPVDAETQPPHLSASAVVENAPPLAPLVDGPAQTQRIALSPPLPVEKIAPDPVSIAPKQSLTAPLAPANAPEKQSCSLLWRWAVAIVDRLVALSTAGDESSEKQLSLPSDAPDPLKTAAEKQQIVLSAANLSPIGRSASSRSDDDDRRNNPYTLYPSKILLDALLIGGDHYECLAARPFPETLAAYWYVRTFANQPASVLITHQRRRRKTPEGYVALVDWWLSADEDDRTTLLDSLDYQSVPPADLGMSLAAFRAAQQVVRSGGFQL